MVQAEAEDEAGALQSLGGCAKVCFHSKKNRKPIRDLKQWSDSLWFVFGFLRSLCPPLCGKQIRGGKGWEKGNNWESKF